MKKTIRLTESQFDIVLKHKLLEQSDINERGRKGLWKSEWNEEDQMLAMYNSLYGIEELGINKEQAAEDIIGTSLASFNQQSSNFDFLSGKGGLDRPHEMQTAIYEKYKDTPKTEFKSLCSDIVYKRHENPENAVVKKKLGNEIGNKRDEIQKTREDALRNKGIDPNKASLISSRPKDIPEPEDEPSTLQGHPTAKDEIRDFLKSMYDKVKNINTKEDAQGIASDLEFIMDYIDNELTDKSDMSMVAEITNIFKNKNTLVESETVKKIKRITDINKKINI
jgi:hypothetical protein